MLQYLINDFVSDSGKGGTDLSDQCNPSKSPWNLQQPISLVSARQTLTCAIHKKLKFIKQTG